MYQITKIKPGVLSQVKVQHQDKIMQLTGGKLEPPKAFDIIKQETGGFKKTSEKAKKADALFVQLLRFNGIMINGAASGEKERMCIEGQKRPNLLTILYRKIMGIKCGGKKNP